MNCKVGTTATWSVRKKQECCKTKGIGCASLFPSYDCHCQPQNQWTPGKQDWCCTYEGVGCSTTAGSTATVTTTTSSSSTSLARSTTNPPLKTSLRPVFLDLHPSSA